MVDEESRLTRWLLLSILVHALLLPVINLLQHARIEVVPPKFVDVDLAALPPPPPRPMALPPRALPEPQAPAPPRPAQPDLRLPERQIVTPPDAGEEKAPPENTRLLSDRDNVVSQESVQRAPLTRPDGAPKSESAPQDVRMKAAAGKKPATAESARAVAPAEPRQRRAERPLQQENTQVASLPKLDQLLPGGDFASVARQVAREPEPPTADSGAEERRRLFMGDAGPVLSMRPGISDFLPGIRESNITLLNTKAERFAPFVRRVAGRVFQHLDIRLRQSVAGVTVSSGHEYAVVEAVMSKQGRLVSARIVERQSTSSLAADRILLSVTEPNTFFDANPPPGAEGNDGNIHFILLVDLQVMGEQDPRSGRISAGYQGIAGVGLDSAPRRRDASD